MNSGWRVSLQFVFAAMIAAPVLPAADSVFADNAFTGRWSTPFEPVKFAQLSESDGAARMNSM